VVLVRILYRSEALLPWPAFPPDVVNTGILLALVVFFPPTRSWFFIPVQFILGYLLLSRFLLSAHLGTVDAAQETRKGVIQGIIDFNDARKAYRTLRRELLKKLGQGEIEYPDYERRLGSFQDVYSKRRDELMIGDRKAQSFVLAFGPTDSAWENGTIGAKFGFILGLPWMVLYLRDFFSQPMGNADYVLFYVLGSLPLLLARWTLYGFLLGYFYPLIRGENGLRKACWFALCLTVPAVVSTALASGADPEAWSTLGFSTLQIFLHMMLLGFVAGDYQVLRRAGFEWGQLLEVHNLSVLSVWGSSVAVALGAAVAALVSDAGSNLIKATMKLVLPAFTGAPGDGP
ncbi:MAG: DUF6185 family protein, partial [Thioalkalivibrio sp.]|nr:DUF6185 family protein [Thioalkalivibrio sp.]